jgi:hypothetical protein
MCCDRRTFVRQSLALSFQFGAGLVAGGPSPHPRDRDLKPLSVIRNVNSTNFCWHTAAKSISGRRTPPELE